MKTNATKSGFTLIELLIVAAVVAVLAAIAVPNYVEAQARSKVSRVHTDLKTLATALEAYAADNNGNYCFDVDPRGWPWFVTDLLTTPIAYLGDAAVIVDPFRADQRNYMARRYRYVNFGANGPASAGGPGAAWPPSWCPRSAYHTRWTGEFSLSTYTSGVSQCGIWKLSSVGPDGASNNYTFLEADPLYDPSNGTISAGDIIRCQRLTGR